MALTDQSDAVQLQTFFEKLYRDQSGYVYLAFKTPIESELEQGFKQEFYRWPTEKSLILARIRAEQDTKEVYFGVALYKEKSARKVDIHGSYVLWAEFDGTVPNTVESIPEPSIRIRSSSESHEHWYWFTDKFLSVPEIELANRRITYALGADVSGWDATQILRPPGTRNHKRNEPVTLLSLRDQLHVFNFSESLDDAPPVLEIPIPNEIPAVDEVLANISVPPKLYLLFKNGLPEGHRSEGLMALAFGFAEIKPMLNNEELLAIMLNADARWGKFSGRTDQVKRLLDIISKVRIKVPYEETSEEELQEEQERFQKYGFTSLLQIQTQIDWVWEGFLHKKGYMLLTGAPGVGKSQMSLNFAANACLGKDFLNQKISEPRRIAFMSLEMGIEELQHFVKIQTQGYTKEELDILEDNLLLFPMGEPLYLNEGNEKNRTFVEQVIGDEALDGIIFDSLGSTTPDELVSEKVRGVMDWNDRLRQRHNCFTWFVHHHRKPSGDNKRPNKLADVYGSMYLTARASSVMCLWEINGALQLIPLKIRLAKKPDTLTVFRDGNLHYTVTESGITVVSATTGKTHKLNENDMPLLQNAPTEKKLALGFE